LLIKIVYFATVRQISRGSSVMRTLLAVLCLSLGSQAALALELPRQSQALMPKGPLALRVPQFRDLLPKGGALRCLNSANPTFGYRVERSQAGEVLIEMITNGRLEGEKTRLQAELKDYGNPFILYLSHHSRADDTGAYFEMLVSLRADSRSGRFQGTAMFTEAFYSESEGKEQEALRPLAKQALVCGPESKP
jgi:hypothetical protein